MMRRVAVVPLFILAGWACGIQDGGDGPDGPGLDTFTDGTWTLVVDRAWDGQSGDIQFPDDPLTEADYVPVAAGPSYAVVVSQGGNRVAITGSGGTLTGTLSPVGGLNRLDYDLTGGTFAGGRFLVWSGTTTLQGELTLYGSGLPIVKSERGSLVK